MQLPSLPRIRFIDDDLTISRSWLARHAATMDDGPSVRLPKVRCPRCDGRIAFARLRFYESPIKRVTRSRPYECGSCSWRGWR